jgi:hypothetical protein
VKVRDKTLKVTIDVFDKKCPGRHVIPVTTS